MYRYCLDKGNVVLENGMKPDLGLCLSVSFAGSSLDGVPNLKQTSKVTGVAWEGE